MEINIPKFKVMFFIEKVSLVAASMGQIKYLSIFSRGEKKTEVRIVGCDQCLL